MGSWRKTDSNLKKKRVLILLNLFRYLHVSRSPITRLDIGVLESLKFLVLANFSDNQLNWVHPRAFRYMEVSYFLSFFLSFFISFFLSHYLPLSSLNLNWNVFISIYLFYLISFFYPTLLFFSFILSIFFLKI